jgi:hypothetical protein
MKSALEADLGRYTSSIQSHLESEKYMSKKTDTPQHQTSGQATKVVASATDIAPSGTSGHPTLPQIVGEALSRIAATGLSAAPSGTSGYSNLRRFVTEQATRVG